MLRRSIAREAMSQPLAPLKPQAAPAQQRSWVARHKVLTAVLIGAAPFAVWGGLLWHTCSNGGC